MSGASCVLVSVLLVLFVYSTDGQAPSTLRFTNILFRHGDRSPMHGFHGDLYNESSWPQGYAQLSQVGMQQEFALGAFMRQRYTGFLSSKYHRSEVYVQSTTTDRTLMSAQCVLAALFPPQGSQVWKPDLAWQPVPVHAIDVSNDKILRYDSDSCPALRKNSESFEKNPIIKDLKFRHRKLIDHISNSTGGAISTFNKLAGMYDTLLCERQHSLMWPKWMSLDMFTELRSIKRIWKHQEYCGANEVIRLTGGMLLDKMLSDMQLVARNMIHGDLKAILYSAHDTTVLALMCALDVYNHKMVPYSTSMYLELHHTGTDNSSGKDLRDWFVQVWLRNDTSPPYLLTVPGCTANCSLSKLIHLTKGNIASDWMQECGLMSFPYFTQLWHVVLIAVAGGVVLVFLILVVMSCCNGSCARRRMRPRPSMYGKLRASEVMSRPEEVPMISSAGGDSDIEG